MLKNRHAPENLDHHCPRCDSELHVARVDEGRGYALALICTEPHCGYVLSFSPGEMQDILSLGDFRPDSGPKSRVAG